MKKVGSFQSETVFEEKQGASGCCSCADADERDKHDCEGPVNLLSSFTHGLLATAFFRCWHLLLFFTSWATAISVLNKFVTTLTVQTTLLNVLGTIIGFVISYRATSSYERYNEGRRYWSQVILSSRMLARVVWFYIPEGGENDEAIARLVVEKKTIINLVQAFGVAVKHYLRGEDGIQYTDLYHLVKHLPPYALPDAIPSHAQSQAPTQGQAHSTSGEPETIKSISRTLTNHIVRSISKEYAPEHETPARSNSVPDISESALEEGRIPSSPSRPQAPHRSYSQPPNYDPSSKPDGPIADSYLPSVELKPARMPPRFHLYDLLPSSIFLKFITAKGKHEPKGKKGARFRAKRAAGYKSGNVPLEILFYITSYAASLTKSHGNVAGLMEGQVASLTDSLTGLERILTTPIPFSYAAHIWLVTIIYCFFLPFQMWETLGWVTIPGTAIVTFTFFGFLAAGEEIENPFGYDKNDLDMDHFTHCIIREELWAMTARPPPGLANWVHSPVNDHVFYNSIQHTRSHNVAIWSDDKRRLDQGCRPPIARTPSNWVRGGVVGIREALKID